MSASPDIFLSYNREDAEVAQRFADAFASEGMEVWWDVTLRSGETYDEVTESALRGAKAVVVLWSPRSVASHWVRAEATIAHRAKTLVPATIESCDKPVMFELTQTADLSNWRGETDDRAWQAFLGDVQRMVGRDEPQSATRPSSAPAAADGGISTVAVLPIIFRGGGAELEFLAEDLTEDITRELANNSLFEVVAAARMAAWRGKTAEYEALGRQLDVRYLIEGRLLGGGETIRLTAQIIDTLASRMVGSKRFSLRADNTGDATEQIVGAIVAELGEDIHQLEMNRAMAKTGSLSGWEHLLRGFAYSRRLGSDSIRRGLEESRQAVAKAPALGLAHAQLASALGNQVVSGGAALDEDLSREIRVHLTRAMQLDGDNPLVVHHLVHAFAALGDGESALRLARRGVELRPNSAYSYLWLGFAHKILGNRDDAIAAFQRQVSLTSHDPNRYNALGNIGRCLLIEGRLAEAEEALDQSLAIHPDYDNTLKWKAIAAALQGKEEIALANVRRLREVEHGKTIDDHVRQMLFYKGLADRMAEPIATLRRLWDATEGEG